MLAKKDVSVAIIDAGNPMQDWESASYDLRVSALTAASIRIFKSLNVWDEMCEMGVQSFEKMMVWDHFGSSGLAIDSADVGEIEMGCVVENRITVRALWNSLQSLSSCNAFTSVQLDDFVVTEKGATLTLSDGAQIEAELLVAADGANSKIRQLIGVADYGWNYQQKALVATLKPEFSHQLTAWQRFLPEGPLALLPLRNGLISIVWTSESSTTEAHLKLSEAAFCKALSEASEQRLGKFELIGKRAAFPLKMQFSTDYCRERVAFIGDAIHTIHPLAGQGANLGLRDAVSLAGVVLQAHARRRDIASQQVLRRYERERKGDNLLMMGIMDGFKRLFGTEQAPVQLARSVGMGGVNSSALIKNQICKYAMGM
jgi:2-octaprenylphenol hydroxylase